MGGSFFWNVKTKYKTDQLITVGHQILTDCRANANQLKLQYVQAGKQNRTSPHRIIAKTDGRIHPSTTLIDSHRSADRRRRCLRQARPLCPLGRLRSAGPLRSVRGGAQFAGDCAQLQRNRCCGACSAGRCLPAADFQLECGHLLGVHDLSAQLRCRRSSVCRLPPSCDCRSSGCGRRDAAKVRGCSLKRIQKSLITTIGVCMLYWFRVLDHAHIFMLAVHCGLFVYLVYFFQAQKI